MYVCNFIASKQRRFNAVVIPKLRKPLVPCKGEEMEQEGAGGNSQTQALQHVSTT